MQKFADPLGIERLISEVKQQLDSNPPTQDQFDNWNDHPITKRLKQVLALEIYERQQLLNLDPNPDLMLAMDQIINYGISEGEAND